MLSQSVVIYMSYNPDEKEYLHATIFNIIGDIFIGLTKI